MSAFFPLRWSLYLRLAEPRCPLPAWFRVLAVLVTVSITACGISPDLHDQTLRSLEQSRHTVEAQQQALTKQQESLDALREARGELQLRVIDLESRTADQNVSAEALEQRLQASIVQREELEGAVAELEEVLALKHQMVQDEGLPKTDMSPADQSHLPWVERLLVSLHEARKAGDVVVTELPGRVSVGIVEPYLFESDTTVLNPQGTELLFQLSMALDPALVEALHVEIEPLMTEARTPSLVETSRSFQRASAVAMFLEERNPVLVPERIVVRRLPRDETGEKAGVISERGAVSMISVVIILSVDADVDRQKGEQEPVIGGPFAPKNE